MDELSQTADGDVVGADAGATHRYLLILRFALVNLVATSFLVAGYLQGWLEGFNAPYTMELSWIIFLVFLYGLVTCGATAWRITVELNDVNAGEPKPASRAGKH